MICQSTISQVCVCVCVIIQSQEWMMKCVAPPGGVRKQKRLLWEQKCVGSQSAIVADDVLKDPWELFFI